MMRSTFAAALFVCGHCGVSSGASPELSWQRFAAQMEGRWETFGFVFTRVTSDDAAFSIEHDVSFRFGAESAKASALIVYGRQKSELKPRSGRFASEKQGSEKFDSKVTFSDGKFTDSFMLIRDRIGRERADQTPHVTERELKHEGFLLHWSLPNVAPLILPNDGERTVALPKFPDSSLAQNRCSITSTTYLYYTLRRETDRETGMVRYVASPVGKDEVDWILLIDKNGKFVTLEQPPMFLITPATEAEYKEWSAGK